MISLDNLNELKMSVTIRNQLDNSRFKIKSTYNI